MGNNYTRNGNQIGYYSLHFAERGDHFVNFTKAKAYFDDGTPMPETIKISAPKYESIARKFTGYIYFGMRKLLMFC